MQRYGIHVDQMSAHGQAAALAAERVGARTLIYRDQVAIAAVVPLTDLERLDPGDPADSGEDALLSMCGTCSADVFVDALSGELTRTVLFRRG